MCGSMCARPTNRGDPHAPDKGQGGLQHTTYRDKVLALCIFSSLPAERLRGAQKFVWVLVAGCVMALQHENMTMHAAAMRECPPPPPAPREPPQHILSSLLDFAIFSGVT